MEIKDSNVEQIANITFDICKHLTDEAVHSNYLKTTYSEILKDLGIRQLDDFKIVLVGVDN